VAAPWMAVFLRRGNMEEKGIATDLKNIRISNNAISLLDLFNEDSRPLCSWKM